MQRLAACILLMGLAALPARSANAPAGKVLFICTGNFFRSAFAEHYFNFLAIQNRKLEPGDPRRKRVFWVAESRGLDPGQLSPSQRAARMSGFAVERLEKLKVPLPMAPGPLPAHTPTLLTVPDLEQSDRIIALHDPTHRPMLRRFMEKHGALAPGPLLDRIIYWNIEDMVRSPAIPLTPAQQAERALDEVQKAVEQLFASLYIFVTALGNVAKAKGMTAVAKETGLARESLYRSLSAGSKVRFDTILKLMTVFHFAPIQASHKLG